MVLSSKQKAELHRAILEYMSSAGFQESSRVFAGEAGLEYDGGSDAPLGGGVLEKKWTSVLRLQKKVQQLRGAESVMC